MSIRRLALAFAVTFSTLSSVAIATPLPASTSPITPPSDYYGRGEKPQPHFTPKPYDRYFGIDRRVQPKTGQTHFIPKPYDRYYGIDRRVQPTPNPPSASHDDDLPPWPEIAFVGVVLLATAGGVVHVRMRRRRRVAD